MLKRRLLVILAIVLCLSLTGCKGADYNEAVEFQEAGDYASALAIYETISDYKDSSERITQCENMIEAINNFNIAIDDLENRNTDLDRAVASAETLIAEGKPALDETLIPPLETAVSETKAVRVSLPSMSSNESEIIAQINELNAVDYTDVLKNLTDSQEKLEVSIKQFDLVNEPTEAYVITCLGNVDSIVDIVALTEENDPQGNLNKSGYYTAKIYFSSDFVDQSKVYGASLIEKTTSAGGSIEVYRTVEDAEKRNEYLSTFDGTVISSASHQVIGTVIVRASNEMTASNQKILEEAIIYELTRINQ